MKKYIASLACALLLLAIAAVPVIATPLWSIDFAGRIYPHPGDTFEAGVEPGATDGYDALYDVLQLGIPEGKYIQIRTLVDGKVLTKDFRSDFTGTKTWEITKVAVDPDWIGLTGTDSLNWTLYNVPADMELTLIDYGTDSTRTNIVETINLTEISSYDIEVTGVMGPYRYLDLVAKKGLKGDVNGDCIVNITDLATVGLAYGSEPGDANWNSDADIVEDNKINILDLATVGINYGRTC